MAYKAFYLKCMTQKRPANTNTFIHLKRWFVISGGNWVGKRWHRIYIRTYQFFFWCAEVSNPTAKMAPSHHSNENVSKCLWQTSGRRAGDGIEIVAGLWMTSTLLWRKIAKCNERLHTPICTRTWPQGLHPTLPLPPSLSLSPYFLGSVWMLCAVRFTFKIKIHIDGFDELFAT